MIDIVKLSHKDVDEHNGKVKKLIYSYPEYCFLYLLPELIDFCKVIRVKQINNTFIGFLSRDSYFTYILYKSLYPDAIPGKDINYIFSSRKALRNNSTTYLKYIKYYSNKKQSLLLVDMMGSGNSMNNYFLKNDLNIELLFFMKNWIGLDNPQKNNIFEFINHNLYIFNFIRNTRKYGNVFDNVNLEFFNRAPHKKVLDVEFVENNENSIPVPIFGENGESKDNLHDLNTYNFVNLYNEILENLVIHPNIRYRTYSPYLNFNFSIIYPIKQYTGLLCLDIDNTCYNIDDYKWVRKMIKLAFQYNIKVTFITSRQLPYKYGNNIKKQTINTISELLNILEIDYKIQPIEIWYNPFAMISHLINKDDMNFSSEYFKSPYDIKAKQILYLLKENNIPIDKCLFFDDNTKNIDACKKYNINSINNAKTGISENDLQYFIDFFKLQ